MAKKSTRPEDDMVKAVATLKAKKKSKTSEIGEMLDRKELEQAPRRPFLSKGKGKPAPALSRARKTAAASSFKTGPAKKSIIPASPTR